MMFGFKKQKPKRKGWDIVMDYLLDNVMEFENYFERQKQFNHTEWKFSRSLPSCSYNGLKAFKSKFFNLYLLR